VQIAHPSRRLILDAKVMCTVLEDIQCPNNKQGLDDESCRVFLFSDVILIARLKEPEIMSYYGKYLIGANSVDRLSDSSLREIILKLGPTKIYLLFETQEIANEWFSVLAAMAQNSIEDYSKSDSASPESSILSQSKSANSNPSESLLWKENFTVEIFDSSKNIILKLPFQCIVQSNRSSLIIKNISSENNDVIDLQMNLFQFQDGAENIEQSLILSQVKNLCSDVNFSRSFVLYSAKECFVFTADTIECKKKWSEHVKSYASSNVLLTINPDANRANVEKKEITISLEHCFVCKTKFSFLKRRHTCKKW
jgi:hypothetical protein